MEQATLTPKYPVIQTPDHLDDHTIGGGKGATKGENARPPLLRRVSHSDPHLDIPHFLSVQDKGFHGFHTTLTSLFENPTTFHAGAGAQTQVQLGASHDNMDHLNTSGAGERKQSIGGGKSGIDRNKSAFELSTRPGATDPVVTEPSALRKVASVANYASDSRHQPSEGGVSRADSSSSFFSSAFHFVTGGGTGVQHSATSPASVHHHQTIPEDEGLTMSVRSASSLAPGALSTATSAASAGGLHTSATDSMLTASSPQTGSHLSSSGLADISSLSESKNKTRAGGMFGFLNRGFFAKPVLNDIEDSYRYVIAADKF